MEIKKNKIFYLFFFWVNKKYKNLNIIEQVANSYFFGG